MDVISIFQIAIEKGFSSNSGCGFFLGEREVMTVTFIYIESETLSNLTLPTH